MIPKTGKTDQTSPRSWRPIALLSCIGKGLERTVARRIAWTAMTHKILSPQHGGALPKRSAADLTAAFTHDTEAAWIHRKHVTMVTLDVQGAFDALLKNRLLHRMAQQGWPQRTIHFVDSFLTDRRVQVRLGQVTTPSYPVACGIPQGVVSEQHVTRWRICLLGRCATLEHKVCLPIEAGTIFMYISP